MGGREEEERREGNPLRNFFKKRKLSKSAPPPPPFSFNRNRLDPSVPLGRRGGGGRGEGWAVIQIRSWNFPQASRVDEGYGGGVDRGVRLGFLGRDLGLHECLTSLCAAVCWWGRTCTHLRARGSLPEVCLCERLCPCVNRAVRSCTLCMQGCVRSGIWVSGNCARVGARRLGLGGSAAAARGSGPRPAFRVLRCLPGRSGCPPAARAPRRAVSAAVVCPRAASACPLSPLPLGPLSDSDKAFPSIVILPGRPGCQGPPPPGPLPSSRRLSVALQPPATGGM